MHNYILNIDYFKISFRVNKFRPATSTKEMFHKRFLFGRSSRSMQPFHHYQDSFIATSVLKYKNYSKFYQMFFLLSGGKTLNPVPTPNSLSQSLWKPFENKDLHFLHLNINSILPKLDELKTMGGNTKAVIIGITESKIDNSISDSEVEILGY